ncbi:MAG: SDR family oxidoreductase, partial [Oscillospiraceae bacterium]|nr:SDR family oxidoreductase [Candidatus Equicaccousia limihippi]
MEKSIKGLKIAITGASSGIGKAIALRLAGEGAYIIAFGGRNKENLKILADEIEKLGAKCLVIEGDLTDGDMIKNGIKTAVSKAGGIDVLINDAGIAINSPYEKVTPENYDKIMNLNLRVPFFLTQEALPYLLKSDRATVINISSVVGHRGYKDQSVYGVAKHGLAGFTKSLACEYYGKGLRVHLISPGGVLTEMIKLTRPELAGEEMILPEDIADTVAFLLKNRGNAVIDEIIMHRPGKEPFLV